jgi:acyl-CoA thioester hydrolase
MFTHQVEVRVRYSETDQMGYVYYGNYASYFEVALVETIRSLGFSYKELEASGVMMPVVEFKTKFIKPARYDDLLTIKVMIKDKPSVKIKFDYEVYSEPGILLNTAETTLVFIQTASNKICSLPPQFNQMLYQYFQES